MKYLLDTNICIYIIKKRPLEVYEKFKQYKIGDIGISSITMAELEFGVSKSMNPAKNEKALLQFIMPIEIIDFDYNASVDYGKIRAFLEKKGTPIGALDTLIAAHALSINVPVITNNEKEFIRVPGLKVENWVKG